MLSIPQHILHQQLFTGGAGHAEINHIVPDTLKIILLNYLSLHCLTITLSSFHPSKCLMSLISWSTVSLWSRLSQSATFSFRLHTFLLLCYPMALLLLLGYSNMCRLCCGRNCTNEWEKMGMGKQGKPNVKQQIHTAGW